jgi:carotenoid cleavage dioxygenase-like enzyme
LPVADLALTGTRLVLTSPGAIGVAGRTGEARIDWLPASLDDSLQIVDAYDDGAAIVLGVITPSIERWVIDPPNERLHRQIVDPARRAFGRVDQRRLGSPHRYLYAISAGPLLPFDGTGIHKHELTDGTRESHDFGPGRHPGDPVFVADPDRTGVEDGGWLLSLVHDDATGHTSLVVLDAADLAGPELAAIHLPRRIPYGLHGTWIPSTH